MTGAPITFSAAIRNGTAAPVQPRARGAVAVSAKASGGRSRIDGLRQAGSLKCLFPRSHGAGLEAVLVNTAGGITGGDSFHVEATAAPGTTLTLTTQAAERAYRAAAGEIGRLTTRLRVAAGARVNWLPQETILFDGSALERALSVDLAPGAEALISEPLVFGRLAMGEAVRAARFRDRIEINRDGTPLYLDALDLAGDIAGHLDRPHVADGARAMASVVFVSPAAEARLASVRALLPPTGGASLIGDDVLALRLLAEDSHALRQRLVPVLTALLTDPLPRCWMI